MKILLEGAEQYVTQCNHLKKKQIGKEYIKLIVMAM